MENYYFELETCHLWLLKDMRQITSIWPFFIPQRIVKPLYKVNLWRDSCLFWHLSGLSRFDSSLPWQLAERSELWCYRCKFRELFGSANYSSFWSIYSLNIENMNTVHDHRGFTQTGGKACGRQKTMARLLYSPASLWYTTKWHCLVARTYITWEVLMEYTHASAAGLQPFYSGASWGTDMMSIKQEVPTMQILLFSRYWECAHISAAPLLLSHQLCSGALQSDAGAVLLKGFSVGNPVSRGGADKELLRAAFNPWALLCLTPLI